MPRFFVFLVLCCIPVSHVRAELTSKFMGIGDLPGGIFRSSVNGVSGDGSFVVGTGQTQVGQGTQTRGFKWSIDGGIIPLKSGVCGFPDLSWGLGISGDGRSIVGATLDVPGRAAVWNDWGPVDLGSLSCPTGATEAIDASFDGRVIVGQGPGSDATIWTTDETIVLQPGGLANSAARAVSGSGDRVITDGGFVWESSFGLYQIVAQGSELRDISTDGTVIVGGSGAHDPAFRWTDQCGVEYLGFDDYAWAVSGNGLRIGGGGTAPTDVAVIWDPINGGQELETYLVDGLGISEASSWQQITRVTAISDNGTVVVGDGINSIGDHEGWIAHIPEVIIIRGDLTNDGSIDINDIAEFSEVVVDPCGSSIRSRYAADMNDDRWINGIDLRLFINAVLGQ